MFIKLVFVALVFRLGRCTPEFAPRPELLAKLNQLEAHTIEPRACTQASPHPNQTEVLRSPKLAINLFANIGDLPGCLRPEPPEQHPRLLQSAVRH